MSNLLSLPCSFVSSVLDFSVPSHTAPPPPLVDNSDLSSESTSTIQFNAGTVVPALGRLRQEEQALEVGAREMVQLVRCLTHGGPNFFFFSKQGFYL